MANIQLIPKETKYNRLTFLDDLGKIKNKRTCIWECECGNTKNIRLDAVRSGHTSSCGCFHSEQSAKSARNTFYKHGVSVNNKKLFNLYNSIKQRCYNDKCKEYKWYGAEGVEMCDFWLKSSVDFYSWCLSNGYKEGLQIDRINNNGNYEPNNCRFVTSKVNCRNRRTNVFYNYMGDNITLPEISEITKVKASLLRQRMHRDGMSLQEAIDYKKK